MLLQVKLSCCLEVRLGARTTYLAGCTASTKWLTAECHPFQVGKGILTLEVVYDCRSRLHCESTLWDLGGRGGQGALTVAWPRPHVSHLDVMDRVHIVLARRSDCSVRAERGCYSAGFYRLGRGSVGCALEGSVAKCHTGEGLVAEPDDHGCLPAVSGQNVGSTGPSAAPRSALVSGLPSEVRNRIFPHICLASNCRRRQ